MEKEKKKDQKKKIIIIIIILILLMLIGLLIYYFASNKTYLITFDTGGGTPVEKMEVSKDGKITLPENPTKKGYTFNAWVNEDGKILAGEVEINRDTTIKAIWIKDGSKTNQIKFIVDDEEYVQTTIENGTNVLLPMNPSKKGHKFVGWENESGNIIFGGYLVNTNTTLTAIWIKDTEDIVELKFDADGGTGSGKLIIINGKLLKFPTSPTKDGYVFAGWVDDNGNAINKNTTFNKNTTLKATWKELYSCPKDCKVSEDGKTCVKTSVTNVTEIKGCPSGTETVEKFCSAHQYTTTTGFDEIIELDAGITCDGNPKGFCVDYNGRYTIVSDTCPSGYLKYSDSDGLGVMFGCAKKYNKGGTGCPSGYTKNGNTCTKTETFNCTKNIAVEY